MDKLTVAAGFLVSIAGLVGIVYGIGINVPGMMVRGANDYSFIAAYILEWALMLFAGLILVEKGWSSK